MYTRVTYLPVLLQRIEEPQWIPRDWKLETRLQEIHKRQQE